MVPIIDGPPNISSAWIQTSGKAEPPSDPPIARNLYVPSFPFMEERRRVHKMMATMKISIMESPSYNIIASWYDAKCGFFGKISFRRTFLLFLLLS